MLIMPVQWRSWNAVNGCCKIFVDSPTHNLSGVGPKQNKGKPDAPDHRFVCYRRQFSKVFSMSKDRQTVRLWQQCLQGWKLLPRTEMSSCFQLGILCDKYDVYLTTLNPGSAEILSFGFSLSKVILQYFWLVYFWLRDVPDWKECR